MKQQLSASILLALTLAPALAEAKDPIITTKAFLGSKTITSPAWAEQNEHGSMGVLTDVYTSFYGVRVAIDLFGTGSEAPTTNQIHGTYTAEAHLGVRRYFTVGSKLTPYIGGGLNFSYANQLNKVGNEKTEQEGMDTGLWLNSGADYLITDNLSAGIDLRYSTANVELFDQPVELDALMGGVSLGFRW